jgi:hypothetical protein
MPGGIDNAEGRRVQERRRADQDCRHADEAMEGRHQLRHRRHLDAPGGDQADRAADEHRTADLRQGRNLVGEERRPDRNRHA